MKKAYYTNMEKDDGDKFSLSAISDINIPKEARDGLLELQLCMATCSINHEYARLEYDDQNDVDKKDELLGYMHECREKYLEARDKLVAYDPYAAADFEVDLMRQKLATLACYQA